MTSQYWAMRAPLAFLVILASCSSDFLDQPGFLDKPGASEALIGFGAAMNKAHTFNEGFANGALAVHAVAHGCDSNYWPCVPLAPDVDCWRGPESSGNGPAYVVGPVEVIGYDIYDLDRDGDGIGCE